MKQYYLLCDVKSKDLILEVNDKEFIMWTCEIDYSSFYDFAEAFISEDDIPELNQSNIRSFIKDNFDLNYINDEFGNIENYIREGDSSLKGISSSVELIIQSNNPSKYIDLGSYESIYECRRNLSRV